MLNISVVSLCDKFGLIAKDFEGMATEDIDKSPFTTNPLSVNASLSESRSEYPRNAYTSRTRNPGRTFGR